MKNYCNIILTYNNLNSEIVLDLLITQLIKNVIVIFINDPDFEICKKYTYT